MSYEDNCKGCRESVVVSKEQIQKMLTEIERDNNFDLVEENVYVNRLNKCSSCRYIEYGSTCSQCGCIVQIRARLISGTCPYPGASRW